MTMETMPHRGVTKNYGVRQTGGAAGQYKSIGPVKTLSYKIDRQLLLDADNGAAGLNSFVYAGSSIISARLVVHKPFDGTAAFTLTTATQGTFPVGAGDLDAVGATDVTPTGNLAVGALTTVTESFALTAANAVPGAVDGEAELIVEYIQTAV